MSGNTDELIEVAEKAMLDLALNHAATRINQSSTRSRLGAYEDAVQEAAFDLIRASESGVMSTIVCSANVTTKVSAIHDQITMSLAMGTPTLDLMLERDVAAATLGAITLGMLSQVEAAGETLTESILDEEELEEALEPLDRIVDSMPWCEHTAKAMLANISGLEMYAEAMDKVASSLDASITWPKKKTQEES